MHTITILFLGFFFLQKLGYYCHVCPLIKVCIFLFHFLKYMHFKYRHSYRIMNILFFSLASNFSDARTRPLKQEQDQRLSLLLRQRTNWPHHHWLFLQEMPKAEGLQASHFCVYSTGGLDNSEMEKKKNFHQDGEVWKLLS